MRLRSPHSPFTALAKEVRPCITHKGESLVSLDIVNSQPLLSVLMAFDLTSEGTLTKWVGDLRSLPDAVAGLPDFYMGRFDAAHNLLDNPDLLKDEHPSTQAFVEAAVNGEFCEMLAKEMEFDSDDRGKVNGFTFQLMYGNTRMTDNAKRFKTCFEDVWGWLGSLKWAIRNRSRAMAEIRKPEYDRRCVSEYRTPCLFVARPREHLRADPARAPGSAADHDPRLDPDDGGEPEDCRVDRPGGHTPMGRARADEDRAGGARCQGRREARRVIAPAFLAT